MPPTELFEFTLCILSLIVVLEVLSRRVGFPPSVALIAGGIALTITPGIPSFEIEPEFVLVFFLPPLLMEGAYFTSVHDFKRYIGGILSLAVGAVLFTTLCVGLAVHWVIPSLPWASCFALGAIVSPPDAVSARAVLERVALPRRLLTELQGESLLNDAAGLTLLRFAVAAALTHQFSLPQASGTFLLLAAGGGIVGFCLGRAFLLMIPLINDAALITLTSCIACWASYLIGESVHVSGVLATVSCGLVIGWYQHERLPAVTRLATTSFWKVIVVVFEAFVFMLIGLTLRHITMHFSSPAQGLRTFGAPVGAVIATVFLSRFVWVFGAGLLQQGVSALLRRPAAPFSFRSAIVTGWAGMRGVVTIAVAIALPDDMPGRSLIIISAFAVVFFTVIVQGTTLGWIISRLRPSETARNARPLSRPEARARISTAQLDAIRDRAYAPDGTLLHPRLLEQFTYRATLAQTYVGSEEDLAEARQAHYETLLASIEAGRRELIALQRTGRIEDEVMHMLEQQLDLQELEADLARSGS